MAAACEECGGRFGLEGVECSTCDPKPAKAEKAEAGKD